MAIGQVRDVNSSFHKQHWCSGAAIDPASKQH